MATVISETLGSIRVLTLNRPEKLNAANLDMQETLLEELRGVAADSELRALVLTGAGRAFSAGGDREILKELAAGSCSDREVLGRISIDTIRTMLELTIPAIAAVNGLAVGYAAGLVALCDQVVMGESAFLSDPHVQYGIAAGPATQLVWPRLCSELVARDILMSGRKVMAPEALRIGLCSHVCPDGEERATAIELADGFVALPAEGIAETKRAFNAPLLVEAARLAVEIA
ncbi:MAG: enoyl-CoA hydratase/isomerase family protein [Novosphingobium sp.]|nr:enoyl-CoA hydratase/isomerase family protein [Novosphingobium sp.]MCP5401109.1 enoyl-CoA hydratase/isomerase family protein [Novosphingobium sp.]